MKKFVFITGALAASFTGMGVMFRVFCWPGAGPFLIFGLGIFSVFFIPSLAKYLYDKEK